MKLILQILVVSILSLTAGASEFEVSGGYSNKTGSKKEVIRIEIGSEVESSRSKYSQKDLYKRLYRLERAVRQLQDRVFDLETENSQLVDEGKKTFTCFIKTNFDGTFTSTKKSLMEAKADAIQKCSDKIKSGFSCDEDKVKCGE